MVHKAVGGHGLGINKEKNMDPRESAISFYCLDGLYIPLRGADSLYFDGTPSKLGEGS